MGRIKTLIGKPGRCNGLFVSYAVFCHACTCTGAQHGAIDSSGPGHHLITLCTSYISFITNYMAKFQHQITHKCYCMPQDQARPTSEAPKASQTSQQATLEQLSAKIIEVYQQCGFDRDASLSILQMLTNVEVR